LNATTNFTVIKNICDTFISPKFEMRNGIFDVSHGGWMDG